MQGFKEQRSREIKVVNASTLRTTCDAKLVDGQPCELAARGGISIDMI